jgi:hypothetical protein
LDDTEVVHGEFTDEGELCNYVFYYIAVEEDRNVPDAQGNVVPVNFFYNWLDGHWVRLKSKLSNNLVEWSRPW